MGTKKIIDPLTEERIPGTENQSILAEKSEAFLEVISAILSWKDPICISFSLCAEYNRPNVYESEARTILPRLLSATNKHDVLKIVHEEFCQWFNPNIAGPVDSYKPIAELIWKEWSHFRDHQTIRKN